MLKLKHYMNKLQRQPLEYWFSYFWVWIIYFILLLAYNWLDPKWEKYYELIIMILFCQTLLFGLAAYVIGLMYQRKDWVKKSLWIQLIGLSIFCLFIVIISQFLGYKIQTHFAPESEGVRQELIEYQRATESFLSSPSTVDDNDKPLSVWKKIKIMFPIYKGRWGQFIQNIIAHFLFLFWWSMFYTRIQERLLTGLIDIRAKEAMIHLADVYFVRSETNDQGESTGKHVEIYTKDSKYIYQGSLTLFNKRYEKYYYYRKYFGPAGRRLSDVQTKNQSTQVSIHYNKCIYEKENLAKVSFPRDKDTEEDNTILLNKQHQERLKKFINGVL